MRKKESNLEQLLYEWADPRSGKKGVLCWWKSIMKLLDIYKGIAQA
jgi:hypothetical protein